MTRLLVRAIGRAGSDPRGLRTVEAGALCAWVDEVPAEPGRAALLDHHRIVEGLGDCLPARFGTTVGDEAQLVELLHARAGELVSRLERVVGHRELAVTGLWLAAATAEPVEPTVGGPGRRFMAQRQATARRAARARAIAEELVRGVGVSADDARHVIAPSDDVAFSSALLVRAAEAGEIRGRLERAEPGDVRILVHGPWPPYTFAE